MNEFWNSLSQELKPRVHELSLYLIAFAFCWLFIFHPELRYGYFMFFTGFQSMSPFFIGLGLIVTGGLLLSLVHVFIKRKKSATEKFLMGWFILGTSGVASFVAGSEMLSTRSLFALILSGWNIVTSVLMLIQMGAQEYDINDGNASRLEVLVTTAVLVLILLFADSHLRLSWATTLSICIFYSTSIVFIASWLVNQFGIHLPGISNEEN